MAYYRVRGQKKPAKPENKYQAKKVEIDGIKFDSKMEAARYITLRNRQRSGLISGLECHPRYKMIHPLIEDPKLALICTYVSDFRYVKDGFEVTEDVKGGVVSEVYRLKRKMMRIFHNIHVREVKGRYSQGKAIKWMIDGEAEA